MKQMDEMERMIQLRAEELGYRTAMLALAVWTLVRSYQTLAYGTEHSPLPGLILCLGVCVQSLSQLAIRQKMIAGDEEYHEPNRLVRAVVMAVAAAAVVLSLGSWLLLRG